VLDLVYPFIERPESINTLSLGFLELSKPNVYLAFLAGAAQYWQAKLMMSKKKAEKKKDESKQEDMMAIMNKQMLYMMPILTVFIGLTLPGGLSLYWFLTTVLTAVQQIYIFNKKDNNKKDNDVIEGEIVK
jgi:YidC/Oxa1 family membrane protein insertase